MEGNYMKKKKTIIIYSLCLLMGGILKVNAAPSYTFKISSSSITAGNRVSASVTVSNTAAWQIKIASAGNTNGCTQSFADATSNAKNTTKTFQVTCKGSSAGTIAFTISGNITDEDGNTINLSGSKSVSVKEKAPDSKVNALKSLEVEGYSLSPAFSEDVLEYSVVVPPSTTKIKINTSKKDSTSSVSGTGEFDVSEGENKFNVDVKAQNGDLRTYTINVSVTDANPINVKVNGEDYTILKTSRNIEIPSLYTETTMEFEDNTIPCFVNNDTNIVLVALKNAYGNVGFFLYQDGEFLPYVELVSNNEIVMPLNEDIDIKNYEKVDLEINGNKINAYKYHGLDNGYYLFKARNLVDNIVNIYSYHKDSNTYQIYNADLIKTVLNDNMFYLYIIMGCGCVILLCLIVIMSLMGKNKKVRKLVNVLEEKLKNKEREMASFEKYYKKHKKLKKSKNNVEITKEEENTLAVKKDDNADAHSNEENKEELKKVNKEEVKEILEDKADVNEHTKVRNAMYANVTIDNYDSNENTNDDDEETYNILKD